MKVFQDFSEHEDTIGTFVYLAVSEEYPSEEERPLRAERTVTESQVATRHTFESILGLIEDAVAALVT